MKTGILTFHNCVNYGAVLQAYALQKVLSSLINERVDVINYENPRISTKSQIERMKRDKSLIWVYRRLFNVPYLKKKYDLFTQFIQNNNMISDKQYTEKDLNECAEIYNNIVFGSDQIWNLDLTGGDYNYYGEFSKDVRKIAYAASVGGYDLKEASGKAKKLLNDFATLSVREAIDQATLKESMELTVEHVIDPTFLLQADEWRRLSKRIEVPEHYILLYLISPKKKDFELARKFKKKTGLPVICVNYSHRHVWGMKNYKEVSPENFLYLLDHAEIVITNSFHGTALSINLNKEFYWQFTASRGKANNRVEEILKRLNLIERCISCEEDVPHRYAIEWARVNALIESERDKSLNYLRVALEK